MLHIVICYITICNMYIPRNLSRTINDALKALPVVVINGPRQSGKSTLLKQDIKFRKRRYISLDDISILGQARRDPSALIAGNDNLIIDEAQRAPEIFPAIKQAVDRERKNGKFIISGSANLLLMKSISESLAGRAVYLHLYPMTWRELSRNTDKPIIVRLLSGENPENILGKDMKITSNPDVAEWFIGGFPPSCLAKSDKSRHFWFTGYEQTYLERDLRDFTTVLDLGLFQNFIRLSALRTAQVLNVRDLARDCGTNPVTISRWLSLLETTHLTRRVTPWFSNQTKRLVKSPKLYFCDSGLAGYLCGIHSAPNLIDGPFRGSMAETYAFQNIFAMTNAFFPEIKICHFRSHAGYEVDFILDVFSHILAIEIKAGNQVRSQDVRGIEQFIEIEAKCRAGLVVYQGREVLRLAEKIWAVPSGLVFG